VNVRRPDDLLNPSRRNRSEYEKRMHRVLEHIDLHLEQPLDLGTLSAVAHFSPFHFHRLFSAWMGERLGDYLRRRRLEVAAMRLVAQPRVPVLHLALAVGFGSAEAFARAFKTRFGLSPSAWRREQAARRLANSNPDQVLRKIGQADRIGATHHGASYHRERELSMNVQLVDRPSATIAYLRHLGPYGLPLSEFWRTTVARWLESNGLLQAPRYGISHDDPSITAPEQCRYDAGAEVPAQFIPSGNAFKTIVPGGRYATLRFKGTVPEVGEAWTALLRDWLPGSGLQLDARPCFEYYPKGSSFDPESGVFECEICIPVMPL
jgi:AraC family transcriptional regulator